MVVSSPTFSAPADGILFQTPSTKLIVNDQDLGTATLYITGNNVVWGGGPASVVTLQYQTITLHAIQRDPSPALFMILNFELELPELTQVSGGGDTNDDDDDDEEFNAEDQHSTQLRFIPPNDGDLVEMFDALNEGQAMNPDLDEEIDEDPYMDGEEFEEGDDEFEDAEEANGTPEDAAARLRQMRLENSNGVHDEDYEEAEIEEQ